MSAKKFLKPSALAGAALVGSLVPSTLQAALTAVSVANVGDSFTGSAGTTTTIASFGGNIAVNQTGGFAAKIASAEGSTVNSYVYGKPTAAGATGPLVGNATVTVSAGNVSRNFGNPVGLTNAGAAQYQATGTTTSTSGFFVGGNEVAVTGANSPSGGAYGGTFIGNVGSQSGAGYVVANLTTGTPTAGIFKGTSSGTASTVLLSNSSPGFTGGGTITNSGTSGFGKVYASPTDNHYAAQVYLGSSSVQGVVVDGAPGTYKGNQLKTGLTADGTGANLWNSFDYAQVNDAGSLLISGKVNASSSVSAVLAVGGASPVLYRSADAGSPAIAGSITSLLDGSGVSHTLTPGTVGFQNAAENNAGDYAFLTTIDDSTNVALVYDGSILAITGDADLINGDKLGLSLSTLRNLALTDPGANGLPTVYVYGFDATTSPGSTSSTAPTSIFAVAVPEPTTATLVVGGLAVASLRRRRRRA